MTLPPEPPEVSTGCDTGGEQVADHAEPAGHRVGSHLLGPHVVGQRVVIRRLLPGEIGPTGGPAMTDVLGICESWADGRSTVRREDGTRVEIEHALIVSGKPVPPRPSVRLRTPARDAHLRTLALWPTAERVDLGDWVLRAAGPQPDPEHPQGRLVRRANSALAMGDPGTPLADAATAVAEFYAARSQPAYAQVLADADIESGLTALGWRNTGPDTLFQFVSVSRLARTLGGADDRALVIEEEVVEEPTGSSQLATVRIDDGASARLCLTDDWVGVDALWVHPQRRRQGLARTLLAEAVDWAASLGATTAYLQVSEENLGAYELYESLGFRTHHAYRYLSPAA